MALISCPECKKEISDQAKHCPNCGYRLNSLSNEQKQSIKKTIIIIISIIIGIVLIAVIYDACTTSTDELADQLRKSKQEVQDIQDEIDDLERQKSINDWKIQQYENKK